MQLSRSIAAAITLAFTAFVGCSGPSPFQSRPMDAYSTAQGFDNPNRAPYEQLAQAFSQQNAVGPAGSRMPAQPAQPSSGNGWMASLKKTGNAISEAFEITPATIPAADPTSLANSPGNVGGALNYHAAKVYETQGNVSGAMALYQKTLQMSPNDVRTMISYGRLLDREGNFREAERTYHRALELEPANVVALNDLGMIYARQGMYDPAVERLAQAVQLQPSNQRYRNNIAIVLIDAGRPEDAFRHLTAVHGDATAHYNLGFLLSRRNMNDQATGHLQQALALNPRLAPARQLLETLAGETQQPQQSLPQPARNVPAQAVSRHSVSEHPTGPTFVPQSTRNSSPRPLPPY